MPLTVLTKDLPRLEPFAFMPLRPARPLGWRPDYYPGWQSTCSAGASPSGVVTVTGDVYWLPMLQSVP